MGSDLQDVNFRNLVSFYNAELVAIQSVIKAAEVLSEREKQLIFLGIIQKDMKLLALSDIIKWEGYEKLVNEIKPDVLALIGDLTDDGFRPFHTEARKHVENFYKFLKYAGANAQVLVIKGNHDKEEDYILEKINNIPGCTEISGKVIEIDSIRFLGLGYEETHFLRLLKPIVSRYKGKIDVVMFHGERLRLISSLEPKLILRGGYIHGKYLVQGIPSVWVSWQHMLLSQLKIQILGFYIQDRISQWTDMNGLNHIIIKREILTTLK